MVPPAPGPPLSPAPSPPLILTLASTPEPPLAPASILPLIPIVVPVPEPLLASVPMPSLVPIPPLINPGITERVASFGRASSVSSQDTTGEDDFFGENQSIQLNSPPVQLTNANSFNNLDLITGDDNVSIVVEVPYEKVPYIIGKHGNSTKKIMADTNTQIVTPGPKDPPKFKVSYFCFI